MLNKGLLPLVAASLVVIVVSACSGGSSSNATPAGPATRTMAVRTKNFAFEPSDFSFAAGDTIEFKLSTLDIGHTFTVSGLGINWDVTREVTQRFTFTKTGTFRLTCAIPGHEQAGMVGKITVR